MNILEAIKSGKRINRKNDSTTQINSNAIGDITLIFNRTTQPVIDTHGICIEDLLADDWEIEEEKIEISRSELTKILIEHIQGGYESSRIAVINFIVKELGFKE